MHAPTSSYGSMSLHRTKWASLNDTCPWCLLHQRLGRWDRHQPKWICTQWTRRTNCYLQMSQLSLRNNRFEFKTSGCLPIILEEFRGIYLKLMKKNQKMSTCNQLDLATLGSQPVNAQKPPQTDIGCTLGNSGDGMSGPLLVFFFSIDTMHWPTVHTIWTRLGIRGTQVKSSIQDIVDEVAPIKKAPLWGWGPIHSNVTSLD